MRALWRPGPAAMAAAFIVALGLGGAWGSWKNLCAGDACPSIAQIQTFEHEQTTKLYAHDDRELGELGFYDQMWSWSRIDYLMSLGDEKFAEYFTMVKSMPIPRDGIGVTPEMVLAQQEKALKEVYDLDAESFDQKWKRFVLRNYPRK